MIYRNKNLIITLPSTNWKSRSIRPSFTLHLNVSFILFFLPLPQNHVAGIVRGIAWVEWEENATQWGANLTISKRFHIIEIN